MWEAVCYYVCSSDSCPSRLLNTCTHVGLYCSIKSSIHITEALTNLALTFPILHSIFAMYLTPLSPPCRVWSTMTLNRSAHTSITLTQLTPFLPFPCSSCQDMCTTLLCVLWTPRAGWDPFPSPGASGWTRNDRYHDLVLPSLHLLKPLPPPFHCPSLPQAPEVLQYLLTHNATEIWLWLKQDVVHWYWSQLHLTE